MDFTADDLASFMAPSPTHSGMSAGTSNERSTNGGSPDESYRHNIFDISAPSAAGGGSSVSASSNSNSFPIHFQRHQQQSTHDGSPHSFSGSPHDSNFNHPHHHNAHFHLNSTLAPLGSSVRYEPLPDPPPHSAGAGPPPSAFPHNFVRHTPSPANVGQTNTSRSRSRSRPPSSSSTAASGGIGPQRTTRTRRNNSVSSTSPPPHGHWGMSSMGMGNMTINSMGLNGMNGMNGFGGIGPMNNGRPQAIVIPRSNSTHSGNGGTPASPLASAGGWEYTLPTPDSLHGHSTHHLPSTNLPSLPPLHGHHHGHSHSSQHGGPHYGSMPTSYGSFGLGMSPPELPPVSALGGLGTPTSLTSLSASPPSGNGPAPPPEKTGSTGDKQTILASEKRRRRRESHNAVERRRRDNINEKISELATLIPVGMLEGAANEKGNQNQNGLMSIPINLSLSTEGMSPHSPTAGLHGIPMSPTDSVSQGDNPLSDLWGKETSPGASTKKEDGMGVIGEMNPGGAEMGVVKANKGMILRKSVEYIRYLQQLVNAQGARNRELEEELREYRANAGVGGAGGGHNSENGNGSGLGIHSNAGGPGARTPTPGDVGMFSMGGYGMDKFGMFGLENLHEHDESVDNGMDEDDDDKGSDYEEPEKERRGRKERRSVKGSAEEDAADIKRKTRSSAKKTKGSQNGHANGHDSDGDDMESCISHSNGNSLDDREMKMEL